VEIRKVLVKLAKKGKAPSIDRANNRNELRLAGSYLQAKEK